MAQFQTPQFIEREAKVIGPLTFRRAAYIGTPLIVIFALWFMIAANNFMVFGLISVLLEGAGVALAFMKVEGKSIPSVMINALFFFTRPRTFVWKRGDTKLRYKKMEYVNLTENEEGLKRADLVQRSKVADLAVRVQTKKER